MRNGFAWTAGVGCFFALAVLAWGQGRKPGLWDVTTTMTWQQSPFPGGGAPPMMGGGAPRTTQVCITQEQMDKFGSAPPQTRAGCQIENVNKTSSSMTADMACTGAMSGKATIETFWTEEGSAKSNVHFIGSLQMGPNSKPVEWTSVSSSKFKSADCGSVKPLVIPAK